MYVSNKTCKRKALSQIKQNYKEVIGMMIFVIGMILLSGICTYPIFPKNINLETDSIPMYFGTVVLIIIFAIWIPLMNGANKFCINLSRNCAKMSDILKPLVQKYFRNLLVLSIYFFSMLLGFVLYIVPGVLILLIYGFVPTILIDRQDIKVIEAFKISRRISIKNMGRIAWMYLTFIPWLLTIPFTVNISAVFVIPYMLTSLANLYRTLNGEPLDIQGVVYSVKDIKEKEEKIVEEKNKKRSKAKSKRK